MLVRNSYHNLLQINPWNAKNVVLNFMLVFHEMVNQAYEYVHVTIIIDLFLCFQCVLIIFCISCRNAVSFFVVHIDIHQKQTKWVSWWQFIRKAVAIFVASKVDGNDATHIEDDNVTVFRACVLFVHLIWENIQRMWVVMSLFFCIVMKLGIIIRCQHFNRLLFLLLLYMNLLNVWSCMHCVTFSLHFFVCI